ncbi:MAG TPA: amino acid ABC transporter permease [Acidimicrobiia bacterium]|nr:amino acid ABC transporter permease [Acidimicrobiia bacterium]
MTSVLFDAPGPRGRRRVLVGSIVAGVALAGLAAVVAARLADNGQFEGVKWGPVINPSDDNFGPLWRSLGGGLRATLAAAGWAMGFSFVLGTVFAVTRITAAPWYRWLVVSVIEILRGVPVVMAIFFASRVLPEVFDGLDLSLRWYVVIGLTAYNSVVIAEIIRSGVAALPRGQTEAAYAIGLTRAGALRLILLPQAFRIMLPALISQLIVILKDTSLGAFISYEELLRRGNLAVQTLGNPLQLYLLVGALFIVVNYGLGRVAVLVERRISRRVRVGTGLQP